MRKRVLLVFPMRDGQTGVFLQRAFLACGNELAIIDPKVEPEAMVGVVEEFKPQLIFMSRTKELLDGLKYIRKKYPQIITASWNVDKRDSVTQFGKPLLQLFDSVHLFYTISKNNIYEYRKLCPNTQVKHLQQGTDLIDYCEQPLASADIQKYKCDVMFAGSINPIHKGRKELIEFLKNKVNMKIYGENGKSRIIDGEHSKACECAKICLSHCGWPKTGCSSSVRIYKIMSAGGFCLEEYSDGIEEFLENKIVTYRTKEECLEKIQYYLSHEEERKKIAKEGMRLVCEKHTYTHRIKQVLEDVKILCEAKL